ncbi:AT30160p [Anopheles sinensis]|uniref:AT30160p n=1 Tax=Anopheles sinensis TaxID=74873 RepID=A0A084VK57_ANOSI|nr:AT30160p [Anopheles sinensis]
MPVAIDVRRKTFDRLHRLHDDAGFCPPARPRWQTLTLTDDCIPMAVFQSLADDSS